jgi:hypothetical protein
MFKTIIYAVLAVLTVGCSGPHYVDYFPYHDDGTPKPKVAIMPILDSAGCELSWDISQELIQGVYYEMMNTGEFYVVSPQEIGPVWMKQETADLFANNAPYVKEFKNTDFIVALEIVERSIVPYDPCSQRQVAGCSARNWMLHLKIRVKVLDIRYCEPKIVLYEVFKTSYAGSLEAYRADSAACWGTEGYGKSFCGLAHQRAIHNLTQRLQEVIWSAK